MGLRTRRLNLYLSYVYDNDAAALGERLAIRAVRHHDAVGAE